MIKWAKYENEIGLVLIGYPIANENKTFSVLVRTSFNGTSYFSNTYMILLSSGNVRAVDLFEEQSFDNVDDLVSI